jgi:4-amino-4-deoxy-L-arabinose transferase-like glycosyltransferase
MKTLTVYHKLILIILLGATLRLYMALNAVTICTDSVAYMTSAEMFSQGLFREGIDSVYPPLYAFFIAFASLFFGDIEVSARMVSFVFATLAIPVSFCIGRRLYGDKIGLLAALFAALHQYMIRYSGEVLAEGVYYFVVSMAVLLALGAIFERSRLQMFLAGLFCALGYITKPEAIAFMPIISAWIIFYRFGDIKNDWRERGILLALGWSVFILMAIPYLYLIQQDVGAIELSGKVSLKNIFKRIVQMPTNVVILGKFLKAFPEAVSMPFLVLFVLGVFKRWKEGFNSKDLFLVSIPCFFWLLYLGVYPEKRYFVKQMPIALVFSALGFMFIYDQLKSRVSSKVGVVVPYFAAFLVVLLGVTQVYDGTQIRRHGLMEKEAGLWLKERCGRGVTVMTKPSLFKKHLPIFNYYGDLRFVRLPKKSSMKKVVNISRRKSVDFLAGYEHDLSVRIKDYDEKKGMLTVVNTFKLKEGEEFIIYRLPPDADGVCP